MSSSADEADIQFEYLADDDDESVEDSLRFNVAESDDVALLGERVVGPL